MKKYIFTLLLTIVGAVSFSSCVHDLDTMPIDDNKLVKDDVYSTTEGYMGMLAKCYASLIQTGQQGGDGAADRCAEEAVRADQAAAVQQECPHHQTACKGGLLQFFGQRADVIRRPVVDKRVVPHAPRPVYLAPARADKLTAYKAVPKL